MIGTMEAASALRVRVPTVIEWIKRGHLEGGRELKGRRWVWRCTAASVRERQLALGLAFDSQLEARVKLLEDAVATFGPDISRAISEWAVAEELAAVRRRRLVELLSQTRVTPTGTSESAERSGS